MKITEIESKETRRRPRDDIEKNIDSKIMKTAESCGDYSSAVVCLVADDDV